jgi:hypothetical protein
MEMSGQLHAVALCPGETRYTLERRLSELQSQSGRGEEEAPSLKGFLPQPFEESGNSLRAIYFPDHFAFKPL